MAHFEVGKKVIAIATHPAGYFKRGQVFELLAMRKSTCNCKTPELHIGLQASGEAVWCRACGMVIYNYSRDGIRWLDSVRFAPYDDSLSETSIEELIYTLEEQTT